MGMCTRRSGCEASVGMARSRRMRIGRVDCMRAWFGRRRRTSCPCTIGRGTVGKSGRSTSRCTRRVGSRRCWTPCCLTNTLRKLPCRRRCSARAGLDDPLSMFLCLSASSPTMRQRPESRTVRSISSRRIRCQLCLLSQAHATRVLEHQRAVVLIESSRRQGCGSSLVEDRRVAEEGGSRKQKRQPYGMPMSGRQRQTEVKYAHARFWRSDGVGYGIGAESTTKVQEYTRRCQRDVRSTSHGPPTDPCTALWRGQTLAWFLSLQTPACAGRSIRRSGTAPGSTPSRRLHFQARRGSRDPAIPPRCVAGSQYGEGGGAGDRPAARAMRARPRTKPALRARRPIALPTRELCDRKGANRRPESDGDEPGGPRAFPFQSGRRG